MMHGATCSLKRLSVNSSSSTFPIPVMISLPPNPGMDDVVDRKFDSDLNALLKNPSFNKIQF